MLDKNEAREIITSRQNPTVKRICALLEKKSRRRERLFRFDGIKLLYEAATKGVDLETVVVSEAIDGDMLARIRTLVEGGHIAREKVIYVSEQVFEKMSEESSPEGVITVAHFIDAKHCEIVDVTDYHVESAERILLAESLRDPGNLGTVIRTSAALGIDRLIITDDCADLYNPETVRAAMGGLFSLDIDVVRTSELPTLIGALRAGGRRIYAAALTENAQEIGSIELARGDAFLIGNEGHGLSSEAIKAASGEAIIPMTEGSESLNAAAAAAICIWETVRLK
jgi:TrmH family RNA methyltransferase